MRRAAACALVAAAFLTAGCDFLAPPKSPYHGVDVTGMDAGTSLRLDDAEGHARSLADFRGKVVTVIFGYTQCPDVCPTTLSDYATAVKRLGADAKDVQVLFVTLDPKRDTPAVLREYVAAFDPRFIALRGDAAHVAEVAKDFRIYAQERPGRTADTYTVDHSAQVFVFDRAGKLRLMESPGSKPEDIAADLRIVMNG